MEIPDETAIPANMTEPEPEEPLPIGEAGVDMVPELTPTNEEDAPPSPLTPREGPEEGEPPREPALHA